MNKSDIKPYANLTGANLTGANLTGADLHGIHFFLTREEAEEY